MNVLIFVITLLMLLSLMTYARLDTFRNAQAFQLYFNAYMQNEERNHINSVEVKKFKNAKNPAPSSAQKEGQKGPGTPRIAASPRINIKALIPVKDQSHQPQQVQQASVLLKNLMTVLYADQPFFQKIQQQRPSFMDDIIHAITQEAGQLPEAQRIKNAGDLANLRLKDPELEEAFYKMMHGAAYKDALEQINAKPKAPAAADTGTATGEDDQSDQAALAKEADEFKSPKGYYSLLDFVTIGPNTKIRVYLAPREVLKAIYHDHVADDIIRERQALYEQADADKTGSNKAALKEAFHNMFNGHKDAHIDDSMLDYSVTKTNPRQYQ